MFSSSGYFRGLTCPYYQNGLCERPYCHFRHVKEERKEKPIAQKTPSISDASVPGDKNDTEEYKPPTSALEKTLQKIEANIINEKQQIKNNTSSFEDPDSLEFTKAPLVHAKPKARLSNSKSRVPEYNPTPLQELKKRKTKLFSVGKSKYELALLEGPVSEQEYDPASNYSTHSVPSYARPLIRTKRNYSFEGEFEPASKKSRSSSADHKPLTAQFSDDESMPSKEGSNEITIDNGKETDDDDHDEGDDSWPDLSDDDDFQEEVKKEVNDSIDAKTNSCDLPLPFEFTPEGFVKVSSSSDSVSKSNKNKQNEQNKDSKGKFTKEKTKESKNSKTSESGDSVKNLSEKSEKRKAVRNSHDTKHRKQERFTSSEKNGDSRDIKKGSFSDKNGDSRDSKKSSFSDKNGEIKKSSSQVNKDLNSKLHSDKHRENIKEGKEKEHSGNISSKGSERKHSDSKEHHPSNLSKGDKVREKSKSHSKDSKCNSNGSNDKDKKSHKSVEKPIKQRSIVDLNVDLFGNDSDTEDNKKVSKTGQSVLDSGGHSNSSNIQDIELLDDISDTDTYEECLKIFNEHKSFPKKISSVHTGDSKKSSDPGIPIVNSKKRIAHKNSEELNRKEPVKSGSVPVKMSPAQVMLNRLKMMQDRALQEAAMAEKQLSTSSSEKRLLCTSTAITSRLANKSSNEMSGKKRIAYAPKTEIPRSASTSSVSSLSQSNAASRFKSTPTANTAPQKTVASTSSKTEKRMAHVPNVSLEKLKRPIVQADSSSKIPSNMRQRYLNTMIDECLKIYGNEGDAFKRAVEEEEAVYKRCSNKKIYLNLSVNTIKRLRNEHQNNSVKKSSSQNVMKLSHEAVLGGAPARKTTFTLNRSGGKVELQSQNFSGADLYQHLKPYILTGEQLVQNNFPQPDPLSPGMAIFPNYTPPNILKRYEKVCVRCGKRFEVFPNGTYPVKEECVYHWGKAWKKKIAGYIESRYTCCQGDLGSEGCQVAKAHVHQSNLRESLTGYMKTMPCSPPPDGDYGVYAMDCEMVYTTFGVELARITVIGPDLEPVYESLVKPDRSVIDYNTKFSGITEEMLEGVQTTLRDVQAVLLSLFTDKTILIGHSLESDLIALKLIHNTVVDTSIVFPHRLGLPFKRALRNLMSEYMQKIIQDDVGGHDSAEDAISCMELMHWKLKEDARKEIHVRRP
ncbi:hypothetical protein ACJMK2_042660 [Sinanodonta woodiana]|uniref:C3H1-type domain-containing protein n=1 Tax=Sinanodonta woodiana TaxID=1069815 RepID=A0ABD3WBC4_SINWO